MSATADPPSPPQKLPPYCGTASVLAPFATYICGYLYFCLSARDAEGAMFGHFFLQLLVIGSSIPGALLAIASFFLREKFWGIAFSGLILNAIILTWFLGLWT